MTLDVNVIQHKVLSVIMLKVNMLSVVMLSVLAPYPMQLYRFDM